MTQYLINTPESVVVRGNDVEFDVVISSMDAPFDLTGFSVACHVKDNPVGTKLFDANVTIISPTEGRLIIHFPREKTAMLTVGQVIYFDIQLTAQDGRIFNVPVPPFKATVVDPITKF